MKARQKKMFPGIKNPRSKTGDLDEIEKLSSHRSNHRCKTGIAKFGHQFVLGFTPQ
jgi:hypothetical protein